ncbi:hypothetical protein [Haladaptatus sp. CMAA 1911]|uniref:hypothetical protein n=1 Tax=unclassified Haladaptatus TaxID=2622732 RepID=UPI003753FC27
MRINTNQPRITAGWYPNRERESGIPKVLQPMEVSTVVRRGNSDRESEQRDSKSGRKRGGARPNSAQRATAVNSYTAMSNIAWFSMRGEASRQQNRGSVTAEVRCGKMSQDDGRSVEQREQSGARAAPTRDKQPTASARVNPDWDDTPGIPQWSATSESHFWFDQWNPI